MIQKIRQRWAVILIFLSIIAYAAMYFLLKSEGESDLVEIYFADRVTAAHKLIIERYNELNKGKVKVIPVDFPNFDFSTNERKEILARSLRGRGDGIDLLAVDVVWVQRFAKWCEPLDQYFTAEEKARFIPRILQSCYSDGELVALPLDMVNGILYFRDDILRSFPKGEQYINKLENGISWSEFLRIQKEINYKNPFYIFPAADYEGFICAYMEILLGIEPKYFEKYGFNFETKEAVKALQFLVDLINEKSATPKVVTDFTEVTSYRHFIKENGLFLRGWPSYDKDFKEEPVDPAKEAFLKKASLPYFEDGTPASVTGGWHIMISKFSTKKKYVVDFLKYLLSNESQELFYRESGYLPVIQSFFEDSSIVKKYPELLEYKKYLNALVFRPSHPDYTKYSQIMSSYFVRALRKEISVKEALIKCTNDIQFDQVMHKNF